MRVRYLFTKESRTVTSVPGNAATLITPASPVARRVGVMIYNSSDTYNLYFRVLNSGESAPTMATKEDADGQLIPGETALFGMTENLKIYAINESLGVTTTEVIVTEFS